MKLRQFLPKSLFKKCLIITGLFLLIACLYILSFIYGKPTIETDYLAQLNQINKPENYNPQDNAWPYYKKAFELFVEPNSFDASQIIYSEFPKDFSDCNDVEQRLIEEWIEQNQPAWQQFVIASKKTYCCIEYKISEPDKDDFTERPLISINAPTMKIRIKISELRNLLTLFRWRIKLQSERTNTEQAIEDCFSALNTGLHYLSDRLIINQRIGLSCYTISNEELLKVISENEFSINQLKDIQERLNNIYQTHPISLNFDGEKIQFYDLVQHVFTKGEIGGGHIIPKYLPPLVQMSGIIITMSELRTEPTINEYFKYLCMSMLHIRRNKTIEKYNEIFAKTQEILKLTPYERKQSNFQPDIKYPDIFNYKIRFDSFFNQSRYFLISIFNPGTESFSNMIYRNTTEYEATITVLALKRYAIEKGNYPESLQELLNAGYITKLPMDPYSDKPLIYKKAVDDFTLYSVGEDFKDDEGKLLFSGKRLLKWGDSNSKTGGDAVFWPVQ
jgi:hypothetical protein